jgi:Icc protein
MRSYSHTFIRPSAFKASHAKLLWLSDLHFDIQDRWPAGHDAFLQQLYDQDFDHLVITGDISNAKHLRQALLSISEAAADRSIYFVLGNHDFYGSSFGAVDRTVARVCSQRANLRHLGSGEIIEITNQSVLIGQRGCADGKAGYGRNTISRLKDANWIADFRGDSRETVFSEMARLGEASGDYFQKMVTKALRRHEHVIVVTHVPPFVRAALFRKNGRQILCPETEQPFFINSSAGDKLKQSLSAHPGKWLTVLCGHTHGANTYNETPSLRVHVAGNQWMEPLEVQ